MIRPGTALPSEHTDEHSPVWLAQATDSDLPSNSDGPPPVPPSPIWLWLFIILIPAGWIGLAVWRWQQQEAKAEAERNHPDAPPSEAQVATNRAGTVIAADRIERQPPPTSSTAATNPSPTTTPAAEKTLPEEPVIEKATPSQIGNVPTSEDLADVDADLSPLPEGYGDCRITLLPRDPQWAYVYWDISNEHKQAVRQQGGVRLALRLCDVTDIQLEHHKPHSLQQYDCDELAQEWYLPIPVSDRNYSVEIGYLTADGDWLMLARSQSMRIPPIYPSVWSSDQFLTVDWDTDLKGQSLAQLNPPDAPTQSSIHEQLFDLSYAGSDRTSGSVFGSQHMALPSSMSSFVFPSGVGQWALPTPSGMGASGAGLLTMSGMGLSSFALSSWASGVGFSASAPPERSRKFWLIADAELIVYGATEPDATLMIDGQPMPLAPDGTFRLQVSFQDGELHYPIRAIAADGEQERSIRMDFERKTPDRQTNTKDEAQDEWF
jgi:hypothetical protein